MSLDNTPQATAPTRQGFLARLKRALPPFCDVRRGMLVWALTMLAACLVGQWLYFRGATGKETALAAIYFGGGLLSWPFALFCARFVALGRSAPVRFLAAFAALAGCTLATTAFLFSQQFNAQFSHLHEPLTTRIGMYQFAETSASGVYQFVVAGIRLYFPVGFLAVFLASLWLARRMR